MNGIEAAFIGRLGKDASFKLVRDGSLALVKFSVAVEKM